MESFFDQIGGRRTGERTDPCGHLGPVTRLLIIWILWWLSEMKTILDGLECYGVRAASRVNTISSSNNSLHLALSLSMEKY